ncbi:hypothetical protein FSP39_015566 [Pinctada imbricata]|uniref:Tyr recombinase domain-containing protein n=1 Tax=Pinctada imbricata TaxID=66713 RepID=A0AA89BPD9_PINIB|nr:hypothetical protein FSP39_015566 [Pinctada imbricata]
MSHGESSLPDEYQAAIALEVNKAMTSSQNDLVSSMKAMIDSNFESFRSSMEATQKELSTTQISKMEESLLGAHKFKRQGNEAQYRGNAKVLSKLHEADEALNSRDITMLNISTARERITEGINLRSSVRRDFQNSGDGSRNHILVDLAEHMPEYLIQSRSDNTILSYHNYFKRWKTFIERKGGKSLPAQPIQVALYLTFLLDSGSSFHVVNSVVYAIKWVHSINGLADPTENSYVKSLQDAAKRIATPVAVKKDPVTPEMLTELCKFYSDCNDLLIVRDIAMILISFSAFLRYDELSHLKCSDLSIHDSYISIHIERSKTDRFRQGDEVLVSKGSTCACPVQALIRYITLAGIDLKSQDYLFKPMFRSKGVARLIYKNKPLSYTAARESILSRLRSLRPNMNLGLHSLRSGGATAAVAGRASERCIMRHGRWKCEGSKDRYVQDSVKSRLSVSASLNL